MIIYYTDGYSGSRDESRRLLGKAIERFMAAGGARSTYPAEADALVSRIKNGEQGKPYIEGFSPFSVSHSGRFWAVLFSDRECGLDIQLERSSDFGSIAGRWFGAEDAALVRRAGSEGAVSERQCFFRIWTRREALAKALGGSAFDSGLPSVGTGPLASVKGRCFRIEDISIDGLSDLRSAVCAEGRAEIGAIKAEQLL